MTSSPPRADANSDDAGFHAAPVVPLISEDPPRLIVDSPLPGPLAKGLVVIRYRTENLRILPVFGPAALDVSPRIGHLHITLDHAPWHWVDASGEPIVIQWLPAGTHTVLIELADPTHKVIDHASIILEVPPRPVAEPVSSPSERRATR